MLYYSVLLLVGYRIADFFVVCVDYCGLWKCVVCHFYGQGVSANDSYRGCFCINDSVKAATEKKLSHMKNSRSRGGFFYSGSQTNHKKFGVFESAFEQWCSPENLLIL